MVRPLRIEYPGAVYHVISRGNDKRPIYLTIFDRHAFFEILTHVVNRYNWLCHGYCLMENHYHLLIETVDPTLSIGMRHLNGVYSQYFNRNHEKVGHLFQGRFKSILVEKSTYLLELIRYIVLNPVRADITRSPEEWKWSCYGDIAGLRPPREFLTTQWILSQFAETRGRAQERYKQFVAEGIEEHDEPWKQVVGQLIYGGDEFVNDIQDRLLETRLIGEISREQRFAGRPSLHELLPLSLLADKAARNEKIKVAHLQHGYTLTEIAGQLDIHYTTVSKVLQCRKN